MKQFLMGLCMAVFGATLSLAPLEADAKRIGGGKSAGMQRAAPTKPADTATPAQNATAPAAAGATAGAAAQAGKRSWMGPIAGLAAGLGIAALLSHFGLGEGFANMLTMVLLALVAFMVIRWLMRKFMNPSAATQQRGMQFAGMPAGYQPQASASGAAPQALTPAAADDGFDRAGFERVAKMLFIRMQAANDAGEVEDLRRFTTPELFASLRLDLQERGAAAQKTDVVQLDAELLERAQENGQQIATVRFHGLIREEAEGAAEPFNELWHFVQPVDGGRDWAIAGIQPVTA